MRRYDKSKFIQILNETPFIAYAAKQTGISRMTIYRWLKDDLVFKEAVNAALELGRANINDLAEMSLIKNIREGSLKAATYYLEHNNKHYYAPNRLMAEAGTSRIKELRSNETCAVCGSTGYPNWSRKEMKIKMQQALDAQNELEQQYENLGYDLDETLESGELRPKPKDTPKQ